MIFPHPSPEPAGKGTQSPVNQHKKHQTACFIRRNVVRVFKSCKKTNLEILVLLFTRVNVDQQAAQEEPHGKLNPKCLIKGSKTSHLEII